MRVTLPRWADTRRVFGLVRVITALTGIVSLIGYFNYSIGTSPLAIGNFFSYFTVQSMMFAVIVLILGAINAFTSNVDPIWLDVTRVLAATYVTVSGIVFAIILVEGTLRNIPVWAPWSSQIIHFVIPVVVLVDWLVAPGRSVPWKSLAWVLIFPSVWIIYTMIRGSSVYWYPYFFLDPDQVAFPFEFGMYALIIIGIITGITAVLIAISRLPRMERMRARLARGRED